jgi:hypothetical protein
MAVFGGHSLGRMFGQQSPPAQPAPPDQRDSAPTPKAQFHSTFLSIGALARKVGIGSTALPEPGITACGIPYRGAVRPEQRRIA